MRRTSDLVLSSLFTVALAVGGVMFSGLARGGLGPLASFAHESVQTDTDDSSDLETTACDVRGVSAEARALSIAARRAWDDFIPGLVRERYVFPALAEMEHHLAAVESDFTADSVQRFASYEQDLRRLLRLLNRRSGAEALTAWLEPRLDLVRAAAQAQAAAVASFPEVQALPLSPAGDAARPSARPPFSPEYWEGVLVRRPVPVRAFHLVPRLKDIFAAAGVPPELVWIAEVESSMNPEAVSPVGARGLFQFMPLTAARFGLVTGVMVDERTDPEKSARAAAQYLRILHRRFGSWELALAAYNAGEGRVGRALAAEQAKTFREVAHRLPLETRLYVPKVLATVARRESIDPVKLPAPAEPMRGPAPQSGPQAVALAADS